VCPLNSKYRLQWQEMKVPLHPPAWSKKEHAYACLNILTAGAFSGDKRKELQEELKRKFGNRKIVLTSSGRSAIHLALKALKIQEGDEIILPSICCPAVLVPILQNKATPVFADINLEIQLDHQSVESIVSPKTKAILVPHLFGGAAPMKDLERLAKEKNIGLIDDAAQSFGLEISEKPLGSFGTSGIIAFGIGKPISSWYGGAWIAPLYESTTPDLSEFLPKIREAKALLSFATSRAWRNWWPLVREIDLDLEKVEVPPLSQASQIGSLASWLALSLLKRENLLTECRKKNAKYLEALLDLTQLFTWPQRHHENIYTKLVACLKDPGHKTVDLDTIQNKWRMLLSGLRQKGFELAPPYLPLHLLCSRNSIPFRSEDLKNTENLWYKMVLLPVDPPLRHQSLEELALALPKILQQVKI